MCFTIIILIKVCYTIIILTKVCFHYHYPNKSVFHYHYPNKSMFHYHYPNKSVFHYHYPNKSVFSQPFHLQTRGFIIIILIKACFRYHLPHNSMFSLSHASRKSPRNNVSLYGSSNGQFPSQNVQTIPGTCPAFHSLLYGTLSLEE